ncbi:hypothetical protein VCHC50A2_3809A, partial [Vibrio cholerae HC-50A2]
MMRHVSTSPTDRCNA